MKDKQIEELSFEELKKSNNFQIIKEKILQVSDNICSFYDRARDFITGKETKEVLENCSDTQRKITDEWDRSSKEKGYVHDHSTDLLETPIATDHTIISKPDNRLVADLTVDELRTILRTEILVNVLPYVNQTKIPDINHGFFQTNTDIRTWIDPNKEPYKTWMQHKDEAIY